MVRSAFFNKQDKLELIDSKTFENMKYWEFPRIESVKGLLKISLNKNRMFLKDYHRQVSRYKKLNMIDLKLN